VGRSEGRWARGEGRGRAGSQGRCGEVGGGEGRWETGEGRGRPVGDCAEAAVAVFEPEHQDDKLRVRFAHYDFLAVRQLEQVATAAITGKRPRDGRGRHDLLDEAKRTIGSCECQLKTR
jgi:hypothetical protein